MKELIEASVNGMMNQLSISLELEMMKSLGLHGYEFEGGMVSEAFIKERCHAIKMDSGVFYYVDNKAFFFKSDFVQNELTETGAKSTMSYKIIEP